MSDRRGIELSDLKEGLIYQIVPRGEDEGSNVKITSIERNAAGEITEISAFISPKLGVATFTGKNVLDYWSWLPARTRKRKREDSGGTRRNLIGPLHEGSLTKFGYHPTKSPATRHRAIRKAVQSYGPTSTFRKLNAVAVLTKRSSRGKSKTYKTDRNWVKRTFMKE